jgi:hypothetical protein
MPQLKIFTACEKVIYDLNTKVPSLIGIFQAMNVPIQDAPIPEKAVAPIKWSVFTLWQHTDKERNIEYTQHVRITDPSGQIFGETSAKFKVTEPDDYQSKNSVEVFGLPVSKEGVVRIEAWLEGIDTSHHECQFHIRYVRGGPNEQVTEPAGKPVR